MWEEEEHIRGIREGRGGKASREDKKKEEEQEE